MYPNQDGKPWCNFFGVCVRKAVNICSVFGSVRLGLRWNINMSDAHIRGGDGVGLHSMYVIAASSDQINAPRADHIDSAGPESSTPGITINK